MASRPTIVKYPIDKTGVNPTNLVIDEPQTLPAGTQRAIVPNYGAYYADSLVLKDANSGVELISGEQFIAAQLYEEATKEVGQAVCAVIIITDERVSSEVLLTYQAIGGDFSYNVATLRLMIEQLDLDNRPIEWGEIIAKPSQFPPAPHLHDAGDLYGFEYLVAALDAVRFAIMVGDEAAHDELRAYIDSETTKTNQAIAGVRSDLTEHQNDATNPHKVTKAQVGLGSVSNYAIATSSEAQAGSTNARYMTPLRTKEAITKIGGDMLNQHTSLTNNPHKVTKAQVGLGNVENFARSTYEEAILAGSTSSSDENGQVHVPDESFMTPHDVWCSLRQFAQDSWFDYRFAQLNQTVDGSIRTSGSNVYVYAGGGWRQIFPAQWY